MLVVRSNIGTTGLFRLLKSTTPEQLVNPKPNAVPYSFETQQKHRWAYRLWEFSLSKTLRGALFALNSIHTGQPTLEFLKWTIKGAVDLAKNSEPTPDTSYEKYPGLISDLTIVLNEHPDIHQKKALESSLCCGARTST